MMRRYLFLIFLIGLAGCRPEPGVEVSSPSASASPVKEQARPVRSEAVDKLARELTSKADSPDEMAQAIFSHLTSKMVYSADAVQEGASVVLREQRGNSQGLAELFHALATSAGLKSKVISGQFKTFSGDVQAPYYWNSLRLPQGWVYFDVAQGVQADEGQKAVWSAVSAKEMRFTHFAPDFGVASADWKQMPRLLPSFFQAGFKPGATPLGELKDGVFQLKLEKTEDVSLEGTLVGVDGADIEGAVQVEQSQGAVELKAYFPSAGDYQLRLWSHSKGASASVFVGSYILKADKGVTVDARPTPSVAVVSATPSPSQPAPVFHPVEGIAEEIQLKAFQLAGHLRSDREKAHALYRYLAETISYDADSYFNLENTQYPDQEALAVFRRGSAVCAGYSNLFNDMAKSVGLESEVVGGLIKGSPGTPEDRRLHAWNAVKIDGRWMLLDSTWGAGNVSDKTRSFTRKPTDDWFLPPAEQFLFSHFPDDSKWLLTSNELTRQDFEMLPELTPLYFKRGLKLADERTGIYEAPGEMELTVDSLKGARVSAQVHYNDEELPSYANVIQSGSRATIKARFPEAGRYELILFAFEPGKNQGQSVGKIYVRSTAGKKGPLPDYEPNFTQLGLRLERPGKGLYTFDEEARLRLFRPSSATRISAQVYGSDGSALEQMTLVNTKSDTEVEVRARCPASGRYKLVLFAGAQGAEKIQSVATVQLQAAKGGARYPLCYGDFYSLQCELRKGTQGEPFAGDPGVIALRVPGKESLFLKQGSGRHEEFKASNGSFVLRHNGEPGDMVVSYLSGNAYRSLMKYEVRTQ